MSNYCGTTYVVEGDRHRLLSLHHLFEEALKEFSDESPLGGCAMYHIAEMIGLCPDDFYCRGRLVSVTLNDTPPCLSCYIESANRPCNELVDAIVKEQGDGISVLWFVECDDDGLFFTNAAEGRFFPERYHVLIEDVGDEWFNTLGDAVNWIESVTDVSVPSEARDCAEALNSFICNDMEEALSICCNFHIVEIVP